MPIPTNLPSNAKPAEIIGHIRHNYPNLGTALRQLLDAFEEAERDGAFDLVDIPEEDYIKKFVEMLSMEIKIDCPHCGAQTSICPIEEG